MATPDAAAIIAARALESFLLPIFIAAFIALIAYSGSCPNMSTNSMTTASNTGDWLLIKSISRISLHWVHCATNIGDGQAARHRLELVEASVLLWPSVLNRLAYF